MKKIQDILMGTRTTSIRDVSIERDGSRPQKRVGVFGGGDSSSRPYNGTRSSGKSFGVWFVAILAILFLFFAFTILFSGTKVVVTQKTEQLSIENNFKADKNAEVGNLAFDTISIDDVSKRTVASAGEEFVETKASGTIIVYNNYSAIPQKLIANTRFQSTTGLIYRIKDPIVVPGFKKDASGAKTPGSLEVVVTADKPGASYNVGKTDFTIPGLKGTDQFETFYARSKTDMTGGFSGLLKKVAEADRASAVGSMQTELRDRLLISIKEQIPVGYVLYDGAIEFSFSSDLDVTVEDSEAELTEKGEARAIVISKEVLSREIAKIGLENYDGLPVEGVGIESLLFVLDNPEQTSLLSMESISFSLKGNIMLVWQFDEEALKNDLVGKRKRDIDWVLAEYPSITEAQIIMRPFWKRNFPDTAKDIKIVYTALDSAE